MCCCQTDHVQADGVLAMPLSCDQISLADWCAAYGGCNDILMHEVDDQLRRLLHCTTACWSTASKYQLGLHFNNEGQA